MMMEEGTVYFTARQEIWGFGEWWQTLQRKALQSTTIISPVLRELLFDKWTLAWSCGAACVSQQLLIFLVDRFMVWCAVAVCHARYRLRGGFPFAFTVFHRSISIWNATSHWGLVGKRQSLGHLFCPLLLCEYYSPSRTICMAKGQAEKAVRRRPPVCIELWNWDAPVIIRFELGGL